MCFPHISTMFRVMFFVFFLFIVSDCIICQHFIVKLILLPVYSLKTNPTGILNLHYFSSSVLKKKRRKRMKNETSHIHPHPTRAGNGMMNERFVVLSQAIHHSLLQLIIIIINLLQLESKVQFALIMIITQLCTMVYGLW